MCKKTLCVASKLLLLVVGINVLITSILLLIKVPVTKINFMLGLVAAFSLYCYLEKNVKDIAIALIIALVIIAVLSGISALVYELGYDGNLYHKFATGILEMGYNPIYDRASTYLNLLQIPEASWYNNDVWVECYPKASWYFDSSIYAWTNWIESAKIFNLLIMMSTIGVCYDYFSYKLSKFRALLVTFILAITPTSLSMIFSFYLDGALGQLLLLTIVILMSITDPDYKGNRRLQFVLLFFCIILCGNLKISGLGFVGIFCFVFFCYWLADILGKNQGKHGWTKIGRLVLFYSISVIVTVCVVGAGTYITNITRYGNVMYPLGAMEGFDIANNLKSVSLENAKPLVQMLCMIFVKTNTNDTINYLEWKVPFTFTFDEIKHSTYDVIRGGTGIFYSGILILGIIMFIFILTRKNRKQDLDKKMIFTILGISVLLMAFIPAGGQTRYSPYVFYPVSFTIYYWCLLVERGEFKHRFAKVVPLLMTVLIILNTLPFTNYIGRSLTQKKSQDSAYKTMKESENPILMDTLLPGIVFNLRDRDIQYLYDIDSEHSEYMKYLWFYYDVN